MASKSKTVQQHTDELPDTSTTTNIPDPVLPKRGAGGALMGKTLMANPKLRGANPRRPETNGFKVFQIILDAGEQGIKYETLRDRVKEDESINGFTSHLAWDMKRNFTLVKEALAAGATSDEESEEAV